ncbi:MAG: DUF4058 family protein [Fimbriiglobus sp.]
MPLNDWRDERGWDGVHLLWLAQLLDWVQPRLPDGFRAYVGSVPALTLEAGDGKPDVTVRGWRPTPTDIPVGTAVALAPDRETVAAFTTDGQRALHVDWHGQLIAAIELVSPRNKDRIDAKTRYARRYLGYLRQGVHLMLVDVFAQPAGFSFADAISDDLGLGSPPTPPPFAVSYRVGSSVPNGDAMGTPVAVWSRRMEAGRSLPELPLSLDETTAIVIDLEATYYQAAKRVYLG